MDNGALVFIIIIEAIVIVWQTSKLKQYHKFEQMLGTGAATNAQAAVAQPARAATSQVRASVAAGVASRAIANSVSAGDGLDVDEELLDMPGVDPEANIEEAKRVQLVMARCRYAEFYLEQLDDDYERGQFQRIVNSCKSTATNIGDPFFKSSALHPLIVLLDKAEWIDERDQLLALVDDDLVKQGISEELSAS